MQAYRSSYHYRFFSAVGSLGALIQLKGAIPDRKSLLDVEVAGPLVGLTAAVVVTIVGLLLPPITPGSTLMPTVALGVPILFALVEKVVPAASTGLHPIAFAGWAGILVTSKPRPSRKTRWPAHRQGPVWREDYVQLSGGSAHPYDLRHLLLFEWFKRGMLLFWGFFMSFFAAGGHRAADQRYQQARH